MVHYIGEISALITALCWSITSIIFTAAGKRIGALQVNLYRLPLAIFLISLTYLLLGYSWNVPARAVYYLAISGIIGLAVGDSFLFEAFVRIGSRLSMLLLSLAPPMTAILAYFFLGETLNLISIVGILLTISGVSWVVAERRPDQTGKLHRISWSGVLFALLAALGQAVGLIFAKKGLIPQMHPLLATLIRMSGAALILWPLSLMIGKIQSPGTLLRRDPGALKLMLLGVFFGPYLGVTLSLISVKYTNTGIAATLMSTVPVMMIPLVVILEKEKPTIRSVAGAVIAVVGVALIFLR